MRCLLPGNGSYLGRQRVQTQLGASAVQAWYAAGEPGYVKNGYPIMSKSSAWELDLGARPLKQGGTRFRVWAPSAKTVAVCLRPKSGGSIEGSPIALEPHPLGYFEIAAPGVGPRTRYTYLLDGS